MIDPRPYQIEAIESVTSHRSKGISRQLIALPTGTGKTVIFSLLAKQLNTRTLIIAHTEELIGQAVNKLGIIWPEAEVGVVKAERDAADAHVVVASVQSACRDRRLERLKEQGFGLLIVDEAHHSLAPTYTKIIRELGFFDEDPNKLLVGVTATPKRGDGIGLGAVFQKIVFERSLSTMIRAGYLAPLVGKQVMTRVALNGVAVQHGDYVPGELSRAVNIPERNSLIVQNFRQYASDRKKAIAFCADVKHAKALAAAFNQDGIPASTIFGAMEDEERKQVLADFKAGKYRVLCNCQILCEGFDEPEVDCVLMARPTKSPSLYTQQIGRGTRLHPLKKNCLIIDFFDNSSRNDLATYKNTLDGVVAPLLALGCDEEFETIKDMDAREIEEPTASNEVEILESRVSDIEFFETAHFAWTPVGDSWHLRLGNDRDVWVRQVDGGFLVVAHADGETICLSSRPLPLDYALGIAEDWSRGQSTKAAWARKDAAWRMQPATQKQLETLDKLGIDYGKDIDKGTAAHLLDMKINEPATPKQVHWLKVRGVGIEPGLTKNGARKLIAGMVEGNK